jgi:ubiquinone/menaquinone biosynthesis C-methylase UbiE
LINSSDCYYNGSLIVDLDSDPKTFIDQDVDNIIKYSKMADNDSVLECGCGSGYFFKRLIEKKPNIKYKGIDISSGQIANAKIVNSKYSKKFKVCDWNDIEYADNSFDTILFVETIGYARNIDKLISECYRILKPGGTIFSKHTGSIGNNEHLLEQTDPVLKSLSEQYGYSEDSLGMMMNMPSFVSKLEEHGFSVPDGFVVTPRDESLYFKSHFIEEVHPYFETIKVNNYNSLLTIRYPDGNPFKFWEKVANNHDQNSILSELGKAHPKLTEVFVRIFQDTEHLRSQEILCRGVIVTGIKK